MDGIAIGQPAPSFRLPSAQGTEVALEDYRGKNHVVGWTRDSFLVLTFLC